LEHNTTSGVSDEAITATDWSDTRQTTDCRRLRLTASPRNSLSSADSKEGGGGAIGNAAAGGIALSPSNRWSQTGSLSLSVQFGSALFGILGRLVCGAVHKTI